MAIHTVVNKICLLPLESSLKAPHSLLITQPLKAHYMWRYPDTWSPRWEEQSVGPTLSLQSHPETRAQNSHSNGPHARAATSMGNAEGLVKIKVWDIRPKVSGTTESHLSQRERTKSKSQELKGCSGETAILLPWEERQEMCTKTSLDGSSNPISHRQHALQFLWKQQLTI